MLNENVISARTTQSPMANNGGICLGDTWGTVGCVEGRRDTSLGVAVRVNSRLAAASERCDVISTDQKVWGSNPYRRTRETAPDLRKRGSGVFPLFVGFLPWAQIWAQIWAQKPFG